MVPEYKLLKSGSDFARNTSLLKNNQTTKEQENIRKKKRAG